MRVGIDIRALHFQGYFRGTGKYIFGLIEGLLGLDDGTQYVLFHLAELPLPAELDRFRSKLSFAAVAGQPTLDSRYPWYQREPYMRVMRFLPGIHWRSYYQSSNKSFAREIKRQGIDVMHFPAPFDPNLPPVPSCPTKTVYSFLDAIPLLFANEFYDRWNVSAKRVYDRQKEALQQADRIVAISECSRLDAIKHYGIVAQRIQTIYCSVEVDAGPAVSDGQIDAVKLRYGLDKPYFVFCSTVHPYKGWSALLEAFARFRETSPVEIQLAIVGLQLENHLASLYKAAFYLCLDASKLCITGHIEEEALRALMKGATALISPSRYEGFGLPAAQALAMGTPVIASNRASLPEVVGDAGLLVDPDSVQQIIDAMERMLGEPELRDELIRRGYEQVKKFDPVEKAREMRFAYESTLGSK